VFGPPAPQARCAAAPLQGKKRSKVGHLVSIFDAVVGCFLPKIPPQGWLSTAPTNTEVVWKRSFNEV